MTGMGGLTAATLTAKRGLCTLFIDQHYIPGGSCSALRRMATVCDIGAAMLYGCGEAGFNIHRFIMNEIQDHINMIPDENIYQIVIPNGKKVTFWNNFERFFKELTDAF